MKKRAKKGKSNKERDKSDEGSDLEGEPPIETMPEPSTSTVAPVETTESIDDSLWKKGICSVLNQLHCAFILT